MLVDSSSSFFSLVRRDLLLERDRPLDLRRPVVESSSSSVFSLLDCEGLRDRLLDRSRLLERPRLRERPLDGFSKGLSDVWVIGVMEKSSALFSSSVSLERLLERKADRPRQVPRPRLAPLGRLVERLTGIIVYLLATSSVVASATLRSGSV